MGKETRQEKKNKLNLIMRQSARRLMWKLITLRYAELVSFSTSAVVTSQ